MKVSKGFLAKLLLALTIFGYPIIATLASLLQLDSRTMSVTYRGLVVGLSLVVLLVANRARNITPIDQMLLIFFAMYSLRLAWDWQIQTVEGASFAILFFICATLLPTLAIASRAHLFHEDMLRKSMLLLGLTFSVLILAAKLIGLGHNPWADQGVDIDRLMLESLNPISIGQASGVLVLAGLVGLFGFPRRSIWYWLSILGIAIGLYNVLLANSRGPIIALFVALLFISLSRIRVLVFIGLVGGLFFASNGLQNDLIQSAVSRFSIASPLTDGSTEQRLVLLTAGWQAFLDSPVFGAFYIDPTRGPGHYPHNLFVEAAMSLGIFGLLLFVAMSIRLLAKALYRRDQAPFESALALYFFVGILFSGSIWGSSSFFMMLGLILARKKPSAHNLPATPLAARPT